MTAARISGFGWIGGWTAEARRSLDRMVDATPAGRAREVDFLRLASIGVVVLWHWTLSVNHFRDGALVMPNPIEQVPLAWLATWLLQVMPVFFLVGGYANLAAWDSAAGCGSFLASRLRRLGLPTFAFAVTWAVVDGLLLVVVPAYPGLLDYGRAVLMPLWFLGAYLGVIVLVPVTAALHRRFGARILAVLGTMIVAADLTRFGADLAAFGLVNTALVWIFVHQLGYFWRDGTTGPAGGVARPTRTDLAQQTGSREPTGRAQPGALAAWAWPIILAGLTGLAMVATSDAYPRSMVATEGADLSHMFPTTAGIAVLAVFQLGVILLALPALRRLCARRRVWTVVVAGNVMIMTVFLWHMTALLLAIVTLQAAGLPPLAEPTAAWWALRPVWLLAPALFLAPLVALFAPVERAAMRGGER